MFRFRLVLLLLGLTGLLHADSPAPAAARVNVPPMKTSIYVGNVTLTLGAFARSADVLETTYEAKVWPWLFWSETGRITIKFPITDMARLALGQTVEFTGDATNHKGKPRPVTGRAQPTDPFSGKLKVRINADGAELVFNGLYRLGPEPAASQP